MDMQTNSILFEESFQPDDKNIIKILGETGKYWETIKKYIAENHENVVETWKFYRKESGWLLQVSRKKRTIFWMRPIDGYFTITFWFGDKAVEVVEKSGLPIKIIEDLKNAKKLMIGRNATIEVRSPEDVEYVEMLIELKMEN